MDQFWQKINWHTYLIALARSVFFHQTSILWWSFSSGCVFHSLLYITYTRALPLTRGSSQLGWVTVIGDRHGFTKIAKFQIQNLPIWSNSDENPWRRCMKSTFMSQVFDYIELDIPVSKSTPLAVTDPHGPYMSSFFKSWKIVLLDITPMGSWRVINRRLHPPKFSSQCSILNVYM